MSAKIIIIACERRATRRTERHNNAPPLPSSQLSYILIEVTFSAIGARAKSTIQATTSILHALLHNGTMGGW